MTNIRMTSAVGLALAIAGAAFLGAADRTGSVNRPSPQLLADINPFGKAGAQAVPNFADLVEEVKPAVVTVRVKSKNEPQAMDVPGNPFEGTPLEPFYKGQPGPRGRERPPNLNGPGGLPIRQEGSGFFISSDGYAVTANHVVSRALKIELITDSGETLDAKVVGADAKADVALLKVDGRNKLPHVKFATTMPKVGDWVVAMGNPFGLGGTVTAGIVSGEGRNIGLGPYDELLQIDAAVNKGNSGGPAFNLDGQVVGVNSAIVSTSPTGGSVGIAFAIPAPVVQKIAAQLKDNGRVIRGWLGVQMQQVTKEIADSLGLRDAKGALVAEAEKGSPAAQVGFKSGDVITHLNATEIKDARQLSQEISDFAPGTEVTFSILRDGKTANSKVKLGMMPDETEAGEDTAPQPETAENQTDRLGLMLAPAATVGSAGDRGLAVTGVEPNSQARELGFMEGDVILQAGGKDLSRPEELTRAMINAKSEGKQHALLLVKREDKKLYVAVPVAAG